VLHDFFRELGIVQVVTTSGNKRARNCSLSLLSLSLCDWMSIEPGRTSLPMMRDDVQGAHGECRVTNDEGVPDVLEHENVIKAKIDSICN
jgi:hypothetical protein